MTLSPQDRADKSAAAMLANDRASKWLGISVTAVAPGTCSAQLTVQDHHLNGHDICHGGFIFTLADTAFAVACNSYNRATVAQHNDITFIAPGRLGDTLIATATERSMTGRSGIYDITVATLDGITIALFRGLSRTIKGQNFPEETQ